jgi:hypothetical protein
MNDRMLRILLVIAVSVMAVAMLAYLVKNL